MRSTLTAWWEVISHKRALGATTELLRVFLVCTVCKRVVPYYRLVGRAPRQERTCKCGNSTVQMGSPGYLAGAAWVIGTLTWRKWIRRLGDAWDPRVPIHVGDLARRQ
jgi:hypothetical protein